MSDAEALRVPLQPLEIIHEAPGVVGCDLGALAVGAAQLVEVAPGFGRRAAEKAQANQACAVKLGQTRRGRGGPSPAGQQAWSLPLTDSGFVTAGAWVPFDCGCNVLDRPAEGA